MQTSSHSLRFIGRDWRDLQVVGATYDQEMSGGKPADYGASRSLHEHVGDDLDAHGPILIRGAAAANDDGRRVARGGELPSLLKHDHFNAADDRRSGVM